MYSSVAFPSSCRPSVAQFRGPRPHSPYPVLFIFLSRRSRSLAGFPIRRPNASMKNPRASMPRGLISRANSAPGTKSMKLKSPDNKGLTGSRGRCFDRQASRWPIFFPCRVSCHSDSLNATYDIHVGLDVTGTNDRGRFLAHLLRRGRNAPSNFSWRSGAVRSRGNDFFGSRAR